MLKKSLTTRFNQKREIASLKLDERDLPFLLSANLFPNRLSLTLAPLPHNPSPHARLAQSLRQSSADAISLLSKLCDRKLKPKRMKSVVLRKPCD